MKTAITHDFIDTIGVPERILETASRFYPNADIYTLRVNREVLTPNLGLLHYKSAKIGTGNIFKHIEKFPDQFSNVFWDDYDLVFSISNGPMRWLKKHTRENSSEGPVQIAYMNQTYPFLYMPFNKLEETARLGSFWSRFDYEDQIRFQTQDKQYARGIDLPITNSYRMQRILSQTYDIKPEVVAPPIQDQIFYHREHETAEDYYLLISPWENDFSVETAIDTFNYLKDRLVILGHGSGYDKYIEMARPNIRLVEESTEAHRASMITKAKAVIVTDTMHFSTAAQEALRMGKPVICHEKSVAAELIENEKTGVIYATDNADGLMPAIFKSEEIDFNITDILEQGNKYSRKAFEENLKKLLKTHYPEMIQE